MRPLIALVFCFVSLLSRADDHEQLYQLAGWPQQREHFSAALSAAQQRYNGSLPPTVFQALLDNSNQRFDPKTMDQRLRAVLQREVPEPQAAIKFFDSPLGQAVVASEVRATGQEDLNRNIDGLPVIEASAERRALVQRLGAALPLREAGAEISLALAGVAADSLSQMLPGMSDMLVRSEDAEQMLDGQRERVMQQIDKRMENTLLYVYRDLDDAQLAEFAAFSESQAGRRYYQAAVKAIHAALHGEP